MSDEPGYGREYPSAYRQPFIWQLGLPLGARPFDIAKITGASAQRLVFYGGPYGFPVTVRCARAPLTLAVCPNIL